MLDDLTSSMSIIDEQYAHAKTHRMPGLLAQDQFHHNQNHLCLPVTMLSSHGPDQALLVKDQPTQASY